MPQRPIAELPKGYTILRVNERHYPLTLHSSERDEPITQAFINMRDGRAVSYSKRVYAANFIKDYISGNVPWAMLDTPETDEPRKRNAPDSMTCF